MMEPTFKHCNDYIEDETQPQALQRFLDWATLPAICKYPPLRDRAHTEALLKRQGYPPLWDGPEPVLFADHNGERVRVTMASRFGDVGISRDLASDSGYFARVAVDELTNFSDEVTTSPAPGPHTAAPGGRCS
jgi:hypothetical protein